MNKPSLPSIQFLLQETPGPQQQPLTQHNKKHYGHRASRSVSSLPLELQSLSLHTIDEKPSTSLVQSNIYQPRQPYSGTPFPVTEKPPSWALSGDRVPNPTSTPPFNRRRSGFHGRSVSEFTLPPLTPNPPLSLPALSNTSPRNRTHHHHRRAVSANTLDFMLSPPPLPSVRAHSHSPEETHSSPMTPNSTNLNFFDKLGKDHPGNVTMINNNTTSNINTNIVDTTTPAVTTTTPDPSGRYTCPYCYKKFSRPSSLRIHTYSHTGEKPFVCTEPGCGRHFSVQSNMRRHLRVHRLGRSVNNSLNTTAE
ncbi:hypothetical protein EDC96DRAFT_572328 [Choanephora cucurbitarum]|nr:hypothetical protein EDC96DRAFT_572328 [Choanephora cucurbitarum]